MDTLTDFFSLNGRTAIVTGGAGLLGTEFCKTLAQAGAKVVIADLNRRTAAELANELNGAGFSALAIQADVTNPESVHQMIGAALDAFQRVDILVNSAALDPKFDPQHVKNTVSSAIEDDIESGAFESFPLDAWKQALDVNLTGAFLCCQAVAKPMLEQGHGVIVNLSSIYGITAPDQRMYQREGQPERYKPVYYSVSKFGILGLTRYLAAYYAGRNIRVNALSPGGVFNGHDVEFVRAYSTRTVIGRMAFKDDMNGALLFLVSDASAYMTGANLVMDGGWSIW